jgi:hypothetical protein
MLRLKKSIEVGARLMRANEILEIEEPEPLEVKFGYDVIDTKNYIESTIDSRVDYSQAIVGQQNPFVSKIDSEILIVDYQKLGTLQAN